MATPTAACHVNTVVVGAGIVGLATARAIAATGKETIILEKEKAFGQGTSSRNSEVIHGGIYYPPQLQPLKAKLCVRGKEMLYKYCAGRVPHKRIGKLVVATDKSQMKTNLPSIIEQANASGVSDLRLITKEEVKDMEPEVVCHGAIFSPSTGIVDSHTLMLEFLGDAETSGASLALNSTVQHVMMASDGINGGNFLVETQDMVLSCDLLVNCAGLFADKISGFVYGSLMSSTLDANKSEAPKQYFAKGNYYKLEGQKGPFSHLIYPVPEPGGLGVHATIDLGGSTRFGPDVEWLSGIIHPDDIDLSVDPKRADSFYDAIRKYWPDLHDGGLVPDYAGIRPKSAPKGSSGACGSDFVISGPKSHKIKGFIDLIGIESPGLTSSMAIAEEIVQIIDLESNR